jgi:gliding motility-associated-like protein
MNDGTLTVNATGTSLEYSLDGTNWQTANSFTALAPGLYTITIREAAGCESTVEIVIFEPQELAVSASNEGPYCAGETIQLHGTTTAAGIVWNWTGPGGYISAAQDPADATSGGTYALFISENGCVSPTVTTEVVVHAVPQAAAVNTGTYCAGDAIQLNGSSDIPADSWQWSGPNGYASSAEDPADATDAGLYILVVAANGCSSQPAMTTVQINAVPDAAAAYNTPFCTCSPLLLYGSSTTPGALTWSWAGPNGYTSSSEDPTDATEAGYYTLFVSQNGCTSPGAAVNVFAESPSVNASNDGPYCEGDEIQLSGSTGAAGIPSWSWSGPNGYTSLEEDPADATEGGIYTLTVTVNGCTASVSTVVTVLPSPVVDMTSDQGCSPDPVAFQSAAMASAPQQIVAWSWDFGDGESSSAQHPEHVYENAGIYMVTLEVSTNMGCTSSVTEPVNVEPAPLADFQFSPNMISDLDPTVQFINTSSNADQYFWLMGDGVENTAAIAPTVVFPTDASAYTITLIAYSANGCVDSVTKIIPVEQSVVYYIPNAFTPDGDEYNNTFRPVFTQGHDPDNYTLAVYNRWGETIFESHDVQQGWDGTYQGALSQEGAYTWSIRFKHRNDDAWEALSGHVSLIR